MFQELTTNRLLLRGTAAFALGLAVALLTHLMRDAQSVVRIEAEGPSDFERGSHQSRNEALDGAVVEGREHPLEAATPCRPPYFVDSEGIRRVKFGCELHPFVEPELEPCATPYFIDDAGIRRVRSDCTNRVASSKKDSCEVPYIVDKNWIRRVKRECL